MKYLTLIWAGLWRKKTRTVLTMLSIVIAFLLFGLLQGINVGMNGVYGNLNANRLYVQSRMNMSDGMPIAYLARIRTVPHVRDSTLLAYFAGFFRDGRNSLPVFATDVATFLKVYDGVGVPQDQLAAMLHTRDGALVTQDLANRFGWKVGDRVPIGSSLWARKGGSFAWSFNIVGIIDTTDYGQTLPSFYINWDYFDEARAYGNHLAHYYVASIDDPHRVDEVSRSIDALFANSSNETRTQSEHSFAQAALKQVADVNYITNAIVGAVLFTLLILTVNTMAQSVRERIPELAVLKTLGFSDSRIVMLVLVESLMLCLFAALLGLALARLAFVGFTSLFGDVPLPSLVVEIGVVMAIALALIGGALPALRAGRLKVVDALAGR